MKKIFLLFAISVSLLANGIAQVTFLIDSLPDYTPVEEMLFIAGNFNGWNPGSPAYVLEKNDENKWFITLGEQDEGTEIQFKFTRGSWEKVEKGKNGEEINNRTFTFGNDSTVHCTIFNWADFGSGSGSTAAENVNVMDENFEMPQLDRTRRIWIYLPPAYNQETKNYPVLYMHDGQNLFDASTSYAGEWEVDETLNKLAGQGYEVPIVVGIDNGGIYRIDEYTPWTNPSYGGGQGEAYIDFILQTLKPYIDANFRTLPGRESTAIMGSSLGGLISHYGAIKFQETFSKAGVFSPSYWYSDSVWAFVEESGKQAEMRIYQMIGQLEGTQAVTKTLQMETALHDVGFTDDEVISKVVPNGEHNEKLWREQFEEAYLWLFASYANDIPESYGAKPLTIYPNPGNDKIVFVDPDNSEIETVSIIDSSGKEIANTNIQSGTSLDIVLLSRGVYFLKVKKTKGVYIGRFIKY